MSPDEIRKWQKERYREICKEFGYDSSRDRRSARKLDRILRDGADYGKGGVGTRRTDPYQAIRSMIGGRTVFVVGAGPSLDRSIEALSGMSGTPRFNSARIMAADTAVMPLMRAGITPDVITTDLDGDIRSHVEASKSGAAVIVHAHGDNSHLLHHARSFASCMGTTQTEPLGIIRNLGGFTDGDRAVFAADHFGAGRIILLGMDFGRRIGRHSCTAKAERDTKIRKMRRGKGMLEEWFARGGMPHPGPRPGGRAGPEGRLFTTSGRIRGFARVTYDGAAGLLE